MRKLFILVFLVLCATVFATGVDEWDGKTVTIAGGRSIEEAIEAEFDVDVVPIDIDQTTGEDVTMTALVAQGTPPDIYVGFAGRAGKYLVPEFAMPLDIDESVWNQGVLDTYKKDGVLYGLPFSLPVQGMAINLDVVEAAGYDVPAGPWTIWDFAEMMEAVKQSDYEGNPTYLYAGSPSADYFWLNWFSAFGVELFADGDYSRSAVNDTDGLVKCMTFLQTLVREGYSPKNSATNTVNEVLPGFREGNIAATGYRPNWIPPHLQVAVDQGKIDKPFDYTVKPFPVYPGVEWPAPIPGVGTCVLAHKTDNPEKAALLTDIVLFIADISQQPAIGDILTRHDIEKDTATYGDPDPVTQQIIDYTEEFMDPGYTYEWYGETRECALPILRDLYNMKITPEEAALRYEEAVNAILDEY
jgi:ABC-type glycerol-3-phosphate transport system substrate-binding protein